MVDRAGCSTHTTYLIDNVEFRSLSRDVDTVKIAEFHAKDGLSASQIAERMGCSKTWIITILKRMGRLQPMSGSQTKVGNYRKAIPPYGFRVVDGKLASHPSEMKVCRLIVELMERRGKTSVQVARALEAKKLRGRNDLIKWHNYTVSRIFARWKGKL